uniref:Carbonic anhydrase n=1 Tax=Mesocestoides corti TaxID=53468 RepID=A0A5K3G617_MESCO
GVGTKVGRLVVLAILVLFILGSWSYTNASSSVDKWGKISSRMCDGARQSPIPLQYGEATYAPNLYPVSVYQLGRFNKSEYLSVTNNGHTLMVFFPSCYYFMSLNGLRDGEFCIKQFHFHWGTDSTSGSEHSLNGRFFPLEMHIVTYNKHLYNSMLEVSDKANGLAVVALF